MPEVEELADAILWVWYPGQEGGSAVADLIFGNAVPSGKLPLTFPESVDQLPPYEEYSMKERTYRYISSKPLYPFGYGLSYTDFSFNDLHLDREEIAADESLTVSVKVKNIGDLDADEVVQLYVSVPDPDGIQPRWSLKNFTRVTLEKGSSTEVSFKLNSQTLEQFSQEGEAEVIPGEYRVYVGNGSPGKRSEELGVQVISASFHIK
jgi:beta-glucosidase